VFLFFVFSSIFSAVAFQSFVSMQSLAKTWNAPFSMIFIPSSNSDLSILQIIGKLRLNVLIKENTSS
jgi:hypothetical protein